MAANGLKIRHRRLHAGADRRHHHLAHDHLAAAAAAALPPSWCARVDRTRWACCKASRRRTPTRVAGAAVFMQTDTELCAKRAHAQPEAQPRAARHSGVRHVETTDEPRHRARQRVTVKPGPLGAWLMEARFGYMEQPDVPGALRACEPHRARDRSAPGLVFPRPPRDPHSARSAMPFWQQRIFIMLANQSSRAIEFFRIPADRVVELGMQMSV